VATVHFGPLATAVTRCLGHVRGKAGGDERGSALPATAPSSRDGSEIVVGDYLPRWQGPYACGGPGVSSNRPLTDAAGGYQAAAFTTVTESISAQPLGNCLKTTSWFLSGLADCISLLQLLFALIKAIENVAPISLLSAAPIGLSRKLQWLPFTRMGSSLTR
jgi:hypothetical protein